MKQHELPRTSDGRTIWRCTTCNVQGTWAEGWLWHGNYVDEEIDVFCPACRPADAVVILDAPTTKPARRAKQHKSDGQEKKR